MKESPLSIVDALELYCNMFVGNVKDFIVCKFNIVNHSAGFLDYDRL